MKTIEVETKFEISDQDFEKLKSYGRMKSYQDHTNIYYDNECKLAEITATFRIKLIESTAVMTLKIPIAKSQENQRCRESLEIEHKIDKYDEIINKEFEVECDLPKEFHKYLKELKIHRLKNLGAMRTQRWLVELPDGPQLEIDRVYLPNGNMFFEVEFENHDISKQNRVAEIITELAKSARPSRINKYQRFIKSIG